MPWEANGNRYVQFAGNGASIRQDLHIPDNSAWFEGSSSPTANFVAGTTLRPKARVKRPPGVSGNVQVVVWRNPGLAGEAIVYDRTCTVAGGGLWIEIDLTAACFGSLTFVEPMGEANYVIRVEIYNRAAGVLHVDHVRLEF